MLDNFQTTPINGIIWRCLIEHEIVDCPRIDDNTTPTGTICEIMADNCPVLDKKMRKYTQESMGR
jgi:hypothetical protein